MSQENGENNIQKKKYKNYTLKFKLEVIDFAKKNSNKRAAHYFDVNRKRVIEWRKSEEALRNRKEDSSQARRLQGGGRLLKFEEIDHALMETIRERRSAGARVTGKFIKTEALRLHKRNGNQQFRASSGWLQKFMRRHKLATRRATHVAQKSQAELDDRAQVFIRRIIKMRREHSYPLHAIGNMDETPIWIDMPGTFQNIYLKKKTCI